MCSGKQRMLGAVLDGHERGQQHGARREGGDGQSGRPGVGLGVGETVDQAEEPSGGEADPGEVDTRARTLGTASVQQAQRRDGRGDGEQQVDVQAPAPRQAVGQQAAEQQPDRGSAGGDRAEDAERLRPVR